VIRAVLARPLDDSQMTGKPEVMDMAQHA